MQVNNILIENIYIFNNGGFELIKQHGNKAPYLQTTICGEQVEQYEENADIFSDKIISISNNQARIKKAMQEEKSFIIPTQKSLYINNDILKSYEKTEECYIENQDKKDYAERFEVIFNDNIVEVFKTDFRFLNDEDIKKLSYSQFNNNVELLEDKIKELKSKVNYYIKYKSVAKKQSQVLEVLKQKQKEGFTGILYNYKVKEMTNRVIFNGYHIRSEKSERYQKAEQLTEIIKRHTYRQDFYDSNALELLKDDDFINFMTDYIKEVKR